MDPPTVFVKQEILDPSDIPIIINGRDQFNCGSDRTESSAGSSDVGEAKIDAFLYSMDNSLRSRSKHNRELDIGEGEEGEEEKGLNAKKQRGAEGVLGINAWPLGFFHPVPSRLPSCQGVVLKAEPLSVIMPVNVGRSSDDEQVAQFGQRSSNCKQFWKAGDFEVSGDGNTASSSNTKLDIKSCMKAQIG